MRFEIILNFKTILFSIVLDNKVYYELKFLETMRFQTKREVWKRTPSSMDFLTVKAENLNHDFLKNYYNNL